MKKLLLSIILVFTLNVIGNAQNDTFFKWNGNDEDGIYRDIEDLSFTLPTAHGSSFDYDAPVGSGLLVLTALGMVYAISRRKK